MKMTAADHTTVLQRIDWLSDHTYESVFDCPEGFVFHPGQRIRFHAYQVERDYSLISHPDENLLRLCIHCVAGGRFSERLAREKPGRPFRFSGPHGYFRFAPSRNQPVFIATGTGIAPFAAFARSQISGFILLHGVADEKELHYRDLLETAAAQYIPCIPSRRPSGKNESGMFAGHVTRYLETELPPGAYDFYLCGNDRMITDATLMIDERFPGAKVFIESYGSP